jgi:hypothetical protein
VYNIPCDCGRRYISEISRPLEVRIKEHKYNLIKGLLEKSKLTQHAYKDGQNICREEANVLQIEPNITYRQYKELQQEKSENYNFVQCRLCVKIVFLVLVPCREIVSLVMTSTLRVL